MTEAYRAAQAAILDRLVEGLTVALHKGDVEAVVAFLQLIAVRDPAYAARIYGTIELGIELAATRDGVVTPDIPGGMMPR